MSLDSIQQSIQYPFSQKVGNGGRRGADFPGGFTITELINGALDVKNQIALVGNMMPMQPFEWSGEQRMATQYYPGNREPAVQILGGKEEPVTIKGRLKDKRYSDSSFYGASYEWNKALDGMRIRGNVVKFGITGPTLQKGFDGSWIRWGFIKNGKFKMNKLSWIDYEIEFLVIGPTQPKNNYFSAPEKVAPNTLNANLAAALKTVNPTVPATMPQSIAGLLNNAIGAVAAAINTVTGFVGTIVSTAQSIEDSANRAIGLIQHAQATISVLSRSIDNLTHGFTKLSSQGSPAGQVRDTYTNLSYITETMKAMQQLEQYLVQMKSQWQAIAITVPQARYRVQSGDTLQNISVKFYGNANSASTIAEHNNLTSNTLIVGNVLEIPKL